MAETKDELPVWSVDFEVSAQMDLPIGFILTSHAAAQSRINALLEEVEKYKADVREALEYAHDCAQQELIEARNLYGHYPLDGLGRKVKQASEQLEIVERAIDASLSSGRSGSGEVSNG